MLRNRDSGRARGFAESNRAEEPDSRHFCSLLHDDCCSDFPKTCNVCVRWRFPLSVAVGWKGRELVGRAHVAPVRAGLDVRDEGHIQRSGGLHLVLHKCAYGGDLAVRNL